MERFEPGNKHKIVPAVAAGGRGAQPCVALLGQPPGLGRGGCLSAGAGLGSGQCLSALKSSHQLSPVPTCSHHHQMCYFGVRAALMGSSREQKEPGVGGGGNDHWKRKLAVSGWKNSARRVSVLAWKCACREISSHPAGPEPGGSWFCLWCCYMALMNRRVWPSWTQTPTGKVPC